MSHSMQGLRRGLRSSAGPHLKRYPERERSLSRLLADQARTFPERDWVIFDSRERLTFGAAYEASLRVAGRMVEQLRARPRVGLLLGNRPEFLIALHGTLLAEGMAFLIDPDLPPRSLCPMLERAGLHMVIGDERSAAALDETLPSLAAKPARVLVNVGPGANAPGIETWQAWLSHARPLDVTEFPHYNQDALVMYTSGTTGMPKGAVLSHHYAFAYGAIATDSLHRNENDVLTGPLPLFHSSGLQMVAHSALHAGCIAHLKTRFSASRFWEEVAADGATQGNLVPEMARMILQRAQIAPAHHMRHISIGGLADCADFEQRFNVKVLWQGYGMTEAYPCPMGLAPWGGPEDTLGMPMDYLEYGVSGEDGRLLAPGETGELVLRAAPHWLFERYFGDEAATAKAFRDGLFHTGDQVSMGESGALAFRGRGGERIRHHGENVDPRAVEAAALDYPGVSEAAAYGVPSELGEDVKLDVVAAGALALPELHAWLKTQLPRHALPRYLERRDTLPRTANLKLRTFQLRAEGVARDGVFDSRQPAEGLRPGG